MPRQLRYFAQPFWTTRRSPALRYEFSCAVDAEEGGRILSGSADGVLVYQQWIDEDAQIFGDPETLQVIGEVPAAALMVDGDDGREDWMHHAA